MSFDARTHQRFPTREKCVSDEHMLALSDRQLLDLSISTDHVDEDIPWTQRINLFYMSPVTIFVLDAILQFTENAMFMIFLLRTELHRSQVSQRHNYKKNGTRTHQIAFKVFYIKKKRACQTLAYLTAMKLVFFL